ncbi:hypothetical protein MMC28_010370 [Mycoblastus sanguinarius]|nr:hypothetical protein [Mycoblastus sanguinarius]
MLEPLDTRILSALSREDSDDKNPEYDPRDHISLVKELITDTEDGNWTDGLMTLLGLWPRINPQFYRKKPMTYNDPRWSNGGPNNWWIEFNDSWFSSLRLKPGRGGVIHIYAFDKRVQSFQIMGCRQNWPAMIMWLWDYATKLEAVKSKHHVKFKAERGRTPKVMNVAAVPEVAGLEMGDVDATWPSYHTSLDAGDPNREMGMPLQTGGKGNVQEAAGTVEDIDIEALEIIDHQQQP